MARAVATAAEPPRRLWAVYDLSVSPTGFDFLIFLTLAEIERRKAGCPGIHLVLVPAPGEGFWEREPYETAKKDWRERHLLLGLVALFRTCRSYAKCASREEAARLLAAADGPLFPRGYGVERPIPDVFQLANLVAEVACGEALPGWQPSARAVELVREWLAPRAAGRQVVTLTLREARYYSRQNSNLEAWGDFARALDHARYFPVVVRDTEAALGPMPEALRDIAAFPEAALNIELRAALYLESHLNLISATGPMVLLWLNPACRSLTFNVLNFETYRTSPTPLRAWGLDPGRQPLFFGAQNPHQRIAWTEDSAAAISDAFGKAVEVLEGVDEPPAAVEEQPSLLATARRFRKLARLDAAMRIYRHLEAAGGEPVAAAQAGLDLVRRQRPGAGDRGSKRWRKAFRRKLAEVLAKGELQDPDALVELAEWAWQEGATPLARTAFAAAQTAAPLHAEALHGVGRMRMIAGDFEGAREALESAVAGDAWNAPMRYDLGEIYLMLGRDDDAVAQFQTAAQYDPSHEAARLRLKERGIQGPDDERSGAVEALASRPPGVIGVVGANDLLISVRRDHRRYWVLYWNGMLIGRDRNSLLFRFDRLSALQVRRTRERLARGETATPPAGSEPEQAVAVTEGGRWLWSYSLGALLEAIDRRRDARG